MPGFVLDIDPVALRLGGLAIRWYGVAVVAAVLVGFTVGIREARRRGLDEERVFTLGVWAVLTAIVGARLAHVVDYWGYYAANPLAAVALREGGLSIYGAVLGGAVGGTLYARHARLPLRQTFDAAAPALVLAQIVGRLGCIVNGDAQGAAADLPWAFTYLHPDALAPELGVPGHPYPVYEIIWNLPVFALLWQLRTRLQAPGVLFAVYAGLYSAGRFVLSFVRVETETLFGLQQAQVIALVVLLGAVVAGVYLRRLGAGGEAVGGGAIGVAVAAGSERP